MTTPISTLTLLKKANESKERQNSSRNLDIKNDSSQKNSTDASPQSVSRSPSKSDLKESKKDLVTDVKTREAKFILINGIEPKKLDLGFLNEYFNLKTFHVAMKNKEIDTILSGCDFLVFHIQIQEDHKYYMQRHQELSNSKYNIKSVFVHPTGKSINNMDEIKKALTCQYVIKRIPIDDIKDRESAIRAIFCDHVSSKVLKKNQEIIKMKKYSPSQ